MSCICFMVTFPCSDFGNQLHTFIYFFPYFSNKIAATLDKFNLETIVFIPFCRLENPWCLSWNWKLSWNALIKSKLILIVYPGWQKAEFDPEKSGKFDWDNINKTSFTQRAYGLCYCASFQQSLRAVFVVGKFGPDPFLIRSWHRFFPDRGAICIICIMSEYHAKLVGGGNNSRSTWCWLRLYYVTFK